MALRDFYKGKRVLVTGHTGFKGQWMNAYLHHLGAKVYGYSLEMPQHPFFLNTTAFTLDDICDYGCVKAAVTRYEPDIIIHMAAQSVVSVGYDKPLRTLETNIMGTANVLQAARKLEVPATLIVTSDKCYRNTGGELHEHHPMGGDDPYSASKGCAELISHAYHSSYDIPVGTVKSGNVIGGGDWAKDRLVPDVMKAIIDKRIPVIRNPNSTRPWIHVLDTIHGYLLAAKDVYESGLFCSYNFSPDICDISTIEIAETLCEYFNAPYPEIKKSPMREANKIFLNSDKAREELGWEPKFIPERSIRETAIWYGQFMNGENMFRFTEKQVANHAG